MKRYLLCTLGLLFFACKIALAQNPPEVIDPIFSSSPLLLTVDCQRYMRNLKGMPVFRDPDGGSLTHSVIVANAKPDADVVEAKVDVVNNDEILSIMPKAAGTATIMLNAMDDETPPKMATHSFMVTVTMNEAPVVSNPIGPQTLRLGCPDFSRDLEMLPVVFTDVTCGPLTYTAKSRGAADSMVAVPKIESDKILKISAAGLGTAKIIVTATDTKGAFKDDTVNVTVVSNQKLALLRSPNPYILTVEFHDSNNPKTDDLMQYFNDPDGDPLNYQPTFEEKNGVTMAIAGNTISFAAIESAIGPTTFAVTADDNCGSDSKTSADFTVNINHKPFVKNSIPEVVLTVGGISSRPKMELSLTDAFDDPDANDQGKLSYSASSAASNIATATATKKDTLTILALQPGAALITVVASDGKEGGQGSTTFTVTVMDINQSPRLDQPLPDTTMLIIPGQESYKLDLNNPVNYFKDDDGDDLFYSARSLNEAIATAAISGKSLLIVSPNKDGTAQVMVAAEDGKGKAQSDTFAITFILNEPSTIQHVPLDSMIVGRNQDIEAFITDKEGITSVVLNYREGGVSGFAPIVMNMLPAKNDTFAATIPGTGITSRGIEYHIIVTDGREFKQKSKTYSAPVFVPNGVTKDKAQPNGQTQTDYRLFSVPLDLHNKSPKAILEDDLGPYDDTKWRFSEPRPDQPFLEFPSTSPMTPGKAFWLLVKEKGKGIDTGPGKTNLNDRDFLIALHRGWNYVGTPFNFSVFAKDSTNNNIALRLFSFNGAWSDPRKPSELAMVPFEGYAIFSEAEAIMFVSPQRSSAAGNLAKPQSLKNMMGMLWSIRILAKCQDARDDNNVAAVVLGASQAPDEMDQPEPPVIGEYVSVYFPHPEWGKLAISYTTDTRPAPATGDIWDFEVRTNIHDIVRLTFANLETVPGEFEVWIMDQTLNLSHNLRESNTYTIAGTEHPKRLQLVVGKRDFVAEKRAAVERTPATFELSQNFPNPFNPSTSIRYGLPHEERVTLTIYNTLGEEVVKLVEDELQKTGYHVAIWDGRNRAGQVVASGVYLFKFQAGSFTSIKKMALVR
jgi:hypothetical protein